jgi:2,4-dienoyl-CoA reductase-like NADH-dependent reductase (Old Yellow Enzyme family)
MVAERYGSFPVDAEPLGQPLTFPTSGRIAKNRFLKSPMAEQLATWNGDNRQESGVPTQELIDLYRR